MEVFKDYAYYYNAFYQDKDYRAEALQVDSLLKKYGENIEKVINYGCGTGRHDIELIRLGYHCTGVDMSPLMIEIAQKNAEKEGVGINFSVADIRDYEPETKYDAVISLFHVMSYQNENEEILNAFHSVRKALNPGGIFLFDVWYGPGVLSDMPSLRVKEVEDENNRLVRIARPSMYDKKNVVDVNYDVLVIDKGSGVTRMIRETHSMRYFFVPELDFLLKQADLQLVCNLDGSTLQESDYDSWTSYFIASAI